MLSHAAENSHSLFSNALEDLAPRFTQLVSPIQQEEVLWRAWIRSESLRHVASSADAPRRLFNQAGAFCRVSRGRDVHETERRVGR